MQSSVGRDQAPSMNHSGDLQNELSIGMRRRDNSGLLQFGVFQQNRSVADNQEDPLVAHAFPRACNMQQRSLTGSLK